MRWTSSAGRASTGRRRSGRRRRPGRPAGARPRRWSAASARCRRGPAGARACRRPRRSRAPRSGRRVGIPAAEVHASRPPVRRPGSACPAGAGSPRGRSRAAGRRRRRGPGSSVSVSRTWTVAPRRASVVGEDVVLALRDVEIDRMEEAVGRVVEGGPERGPRSLDEDVEQRSGHALGAVRRGVVVPSSAGYRQRRVRMPPLRRWCRRATPRRTGTGPVRQGHGRVRPNRYPVRVSAYAAMARIRDAQPRARPARLSLVRELVSAGCGAADRVVEVDLVGRSFDDRLAEWWDSLTENLSQTTFFLLDPESWR